MHEKGILWKQMYNKSQENQYPTKSLADETVIINIIINK